MTQPTAQRVTRPRGLAGALSVAIVLTTLAGCTSFHAYRRAQIAERDGDWDQAVILYMDAASQEPGNLSYRSALLRAKISASQQHFEKAKQYLAARVPERALVELQNAVDLDPTNQYAEVELAKVRRALDAAARNQPAPATIDEMKAKTRGTSAQPPLLSPRSPDPINVNFPQPTSILTIYRALAKGFGFNVFFDPNMRDQQLAIELNEVTAEKALEVICRAGQHFYKVVDEHTILIAPDNAQNRRLYEDQVIQTFFLSNADPKIIMNLLRSLVDARKLSPNEQLNALTIRETADKVKVAESLIRANDKAQAEVVVDIELMQLNTSKLRDLGMQLTDYRVEQNLDLGSKDAVLRLSDLQFLNQSSWALKIPGFVYSFLKQRGDAQLLAQPRLRISEGKTGKLTIGDKIPIPVTTFNSANVQGGSIVPITSFQYTDVGIKIELEPRVHHNREVTLKLKIEVSNRAGEVAVPGGGSQPIIGTRAIESTIRLQDGETNFLAGLIRTDETGLERGIPGLSDVPLLGRLFSQHRVDNQRTDLILTLTPHIVRTPDITEEDLLPMWVGTEQNVSFRGSNARIESDIQGPFDVPTDDPEAMRELIRQRVEGLQQNGGAAFGIPVQDPSAPTPAPVPPPGVNLAPGVAPSDMFTPPPEEKEPPPEDGSKTLARRTARQAGTGPPLESESEYVRAGLAARQAAIEEAKVELRLLTSSPQVLAGESFEVAVLARTGVPVAHWPLALSFDPRRLRFERVEAGSFAGRPGEVQALADASTPGEVLLGVSGLGETPGSTGSGIVAKLSFRALAAGATELAFLVAKPLDAARAPVGPVDDRPLTVSVLAARGDREPPLRRPGEP
jgi:general secretion pathway protein D